ncbi:MAG: GAF domain-containing sensor histidine kinase [Anaerolineales bacterium]
MQTQAISDLQERLDGYRRLIEISRDLASTLDLESLLYRIIHAAADLTHAAAASILLYDDAAQQLNFQVATNLDQQTMRGLVVPLEGSIAGWIVTHRQPVRIDNVHSDARFFAEVEKMTQFTTTSLMGIPLITKDKVVGVLEVINKRSGSFTEVDQDLLLVLGAQAAVAIVNARLFAQSDLIAEFVHELRTPLASIGTSTYLLLRPEMSQEQREQIIHNIHSETQRLSTLASTFLDLARLESGRVKYNFSRFDLLPVVQECCQVMQAKADEAELRLHVDIPADFPPVSADRDKLKQVIINLLSNAVKYNCRGGQVFVRAGLEEKCWWLAVEDTGLGIPEDDLPHLFQKFYRVRSTEGKASGTGLGLSICKQIVSGHRGRIEVSSKLGEGTTFTVRFPRI